MAKKNPILPQNNRTRGVRTYIGGKDSGYIEKVRTLSDRAIEYAMRAHKQFMAHSELKKPYRATEYEEMEYATPPNTPYPPPYYPRPPKPGDTTPDPPGPIPPVPTPGPINPDPVIPPWVNVYFCQVPSFYFCPGGGAVIVVVNGNSPLTSVGVQFPEGSTAGVSGNTVVFVPGGGTGTVILNVTTKHGATCIGMGYAKDPSECSAICGTPSIGYTTVSMATGESQQLTVVNGVAGTTYTWTVISGGGSITPEGLYTAPSTNAECASNPLIGLYCNGAIMSYLAMGVNGFTGVQVAYWTSATVGTGCTWNYTAQAYKCDGTTSGVTQSCASCSCTACPQCCCYPVNVPAPCTSCGNPPPSVCQAMAVCEESSVITCYGGVCIDNNLPTPGTYDRRTALMITGGCCPGAIL